MVAETVLNFLLAFAGGGGSSGSSSFLSANLLSVRAAAAVS